MSEPQMCTAADLTGEDPCLRLAQWIWHPEGDRPVWLCNFHAEPLAGSCWQEVQP